MGWQSENLSKLKMGRGLCGARATNRWFSGRRQSQATRTSSVIAESLLNAGHILQDKRDGFAKVVAIRTLLRILILESLAEHQQRVHVELSATMDMLLLIASGVALLRTAKYCRRSSTLVLLVWKPVWTRFSAYGELWSKWAKLERLVHWLDDSASC
jgi:hypothetical protein